MCRLLAKWEQYDNDLAKSSSRINGKTNNELKQSVNELIFSSIDSVTAD